MGRYSTGEKTKEALIEAAGNLAAEVGIAKISTREVARRAGENIGSIHYHFKSKEGLLMAVLDKATEDKRLNPLHNVLKKYETCLDRPTEQAKAMADAIDWSMQALRDNRPRWCCKILSQILQNDSPLRDRLFRDVLDPSFEAFKKLLCTLEPGLSRADAFCEFMTTCSPIYIYTDYRDNLKDKLGEDFIEETYIKRLRKAIILRTLLYFNLPVEEFR